MNVPSLAWLQDPWSPAGYDVVELADDAPADRPSDDWDVPKTARSPLGYRVVELTPPASPESLEWAEEIDAVVEEVVFAADGGDDADADHNLAPARVVKQRPPRQPRRRWLWPSVGLGVSCLAALALVLMLVGLQAQARSVRPAEVRAQQQKPPAAPEEVWPPDRLTFGTSIQFVRNAPEAQRVADKQHKLTCLLHVSGNFEDAGFT
jgi:hypothetical protein